MATLKDVANKAGMSVTTVATILRGQTQRYAADTIAQVHAAAQDVGYVPNHFSRQLVKGRTGVILFVLSRGTGATFNQQILLSLPEAARAAGYELLLEPVAPEALKPADASFLKGRYFDGILLNQTGWTEAQMGQMESELGHAAIPHVWFNQDRESNAVYPDEAGDSARLGERLWEAGHRHLLYVGHAPSHAHFSSKVRYHGLKKTFIDHGGIWAECLTPMDRDWAKGEGAWKESLRKLRNPPAMWDAVVFSHPFLAPLFLGEVGPQNAPFFSFDAPPDAWGDLDWYGQFIPWEELARRAVDLLASRMSNGNRSAPSVKLPGELRFPGKASAPSRN